MMRLTILEYASQAMVPPPSVLFVPPGATIGRGADNHLVLVDETRQISRLQASLRVGEGGAYLKNLSSVCSIDINQRALPNEHEQRLHDGDLIGIGVYLLRVDAAAPDASCRVSTNEHAYHLERNTVEIPSAHATPAISVMPAAGLAEPVSEGDRALDSASTPPAAFWDSLVAEFSPTASPQVAQFDRRGQTVFLLDIADRAPSCPSLGVECALSELQGLPLDPLDLFAAIPHDGSIALFNDNPGVFSAQAQDPLAVSATTANTAAQRNDAHEIASHFLMPRLTAQSPEVPVVATPMPQPAQSSDRQSVRYSSGGDAMDVPPHHPQHVQNAQQPVQQIGIDSASAARLMQADHAIVEATLPWDAFMEGAGIGGDTNTPTQAQCRQAGRMLSGLIAGSMELLASRTIIKREVKADLTMILDRENNPLKLLPDAQTVLKQMFGQPFPGFMPPEQALADAFHDLHAHQIGMLAGMRAALNQLLRDLSPEQIAQHGVPRRWYESLIPHTKASRAWVQYCKLHRSMLDAVEDDFNTVFGNAFLAAYDAEAELYRQQRKESAEC
jgi:FHA domain-containing protein